jgi:hypothetical protein
VLCCHRYVSGQADPDVDNSRLFVQEEKLDEYDTQTDPPGLHLIPLPFADEIREPPVNESHRGIIIITYITS